MNKEIEDNSKVLGTLREEFNDVEMRVMDVEMLARGAHLMLSSTKEEVGGMRVEVRDLNNIVANFSNQLESVCQEDVAWC
jgi:archaellum component FlaC